MSVSIIDNYLTSELGDIDLYSDIGDSIECTNYAKVVYNDEKNKRNSEKSYDTNDDDHYSNDSTTIKKVGFYRQNLTLRKRNSIELARLRSKRKNSEHKTDSLIIGKDSDRIYDNINNHRAAIQYKRYGQFLSLSNDAEPDKKYIIDMFDLYSKLDRKTQVSKKKSWFKKITSIFNLS